MQKQTVIDKNSTAKWEDKHDKRKFEQKKKVRQWKQFVNAWDLAIANVKMILGYTRILLSISLHFNESNV